MTLKMPMFQAQAELTELLKDGFRVLDILQQPAERLPDSGLLKSEIEVWRARVQNTLNQVFPTQAEASAFKNLPPRTPPYNWTYLRANDKAVYSHLGRLDGLQAMLREDLPLYAEPSPDPPITKPADTTDSHDKGQEMRHDETGATTRMEREVGRAPRALISYAWESEHHREWVRNLAARLREDGVETILDQWHAIPGDQLTEFMERGVRENDYVLIICTPTYKQRSDGRTGGVGYEGDIISAEVFATRNHRKFIPLLRRGEWQDAAPSALLGKVYVDLRGDPYSHQHYGDLLATLHGRRKQAPPIGPAPTIASTNPARERPKDDPRPDAPVTITGIIVDEISVPRGDGSAGSALYAIPFQLSRIPSSQWAEVFIETWNRPPSFTLMHRAGIARVVGDRIVLDGTTIEEVERYHRDTLKSVIPRVNEQVAALEAARQARDEAERQRLRGREAAIAEAAKRITFE